MESKIKMMAAATEALKFLRSNTKVTDEEVLQDVANFGPKGRGVSGQ